MLRCKGEAIQLLLGLGGNIDDFLHVEALRFRVHLVGLQLFAQILAEQATRHLIAITVPIEV